MASQAKITSFYRNAKQNSNILASKRRKAVIVDEDITTSTLPNPVKQESSTTESSITIHPAETCSSEEKTPLVPKTQSLEPAPEATPSNKNKELPVPVSNLKDTIDLSETIKEVKKKPSVRKTRQSTKTKETPLITALFKPSSKQGKAEKSSSEDYTEEVTCVQDNHGCSPEVKELLTPKQVNDNSLSTRKRKMQVSMQESQKTVVTPIKVEEKQLNRTPVKVRKRLEMTGESAPELKTASPAKQVQFICMGALSPAKNASPYKSPRTAPKPSEGTAPVIKSPAVKSLASLLDKAAPIKLTPEEVKSRLGKSKNLSELQARLRKVSDCSSKLKEFQSQMQLKKFSTLELNIDVPVSPHKSPLKHQSPVKRAVEKRPAFERFHALAQPPSASLVLPYSYKVLAEVFRCLETVVVMLYNRKECIYFSKLKPAVQKMLQKDFTEKHLAQICHVFPTAYTLAMEKPMPNQQNSPFKARGYQITVTPNTNYLGPELFNDGESQPPTDSASQGQKAFQPIGPTLLVERRYVFHNRLLKIVKEHHANFLATHNPMLVVPENKITRWHPSFDVDGVPDVPRAPLPQPPEVKTFHTAKDVLEHAHGLVKVNPRLEAALKERAALFKGEEPAPPKPAEAEKPVPPAANPGLKGVSQSLIDKIRAREAAKAQKQMTMNPEEIRRQGMAKILPEIARIISSIFITEKKGVLPLTPLIEKVQYSYNGILSSANIDEHIRLLHKVVPEWLTILNRSNVDYVKVSRNIDSNVVYQKLEDNAKA